MPLSDQPPLLHLLFFSLTLSISLFPRHPPTTSTSVTPWPWRRKGSGAAPRCSPAEPPLPCVQPSLCPPPPPPPARQVTGASMLPGPSSWNLQMERGNQTPKSSVTILTKQANKRLPNNSPKEMEREIERAREKEPNETV